MRHWIFQANPKHYDIDAALLALDRIMWRVPQYTGDISVGDRVVLWRSGSERGIVAVGVVASAPAVVTSPAAESRYANDESAEGQSATRVEIRLVPVPHVSKEVVESVPAMAGHQIVSAPMGTVFPLSPEEWVGLASLWSVDLPELPHGSAEKPSFPSAFSWMDRKKDIYPMPGGYDQYLKSLHKILDYVATNRPAIDELTSQLQEMFGSSPTNARHISLFIKRAGFVVDQAGLLEVSELGAVFLTEADASLIVALLHQRFRFVGEMLQQLKQPRSPEYLLEIASSQYATGWTTKAQIQRRRGWFQSAGVVTLNDDGELLLTDTGLAILERLTLQPPFELDDLEQFNEPEVVAVLEPQLAIGQPNEELEALVERVRTSSINSQSPDDFEFAIRDVFAFLGFRAEKLGGSGKTDVVPDADLGLENSYRVIVDGKTTSRGAVTDGQIDWDTIDDHRRLHSADFAVIAGPAFGAERVLNRAADHGVTLLTASDLVDLVRQHASAPLDLDDYRSLFEWAGGEGNLEVLSDAVDTRTRLVEIAVAALGEIEEHVSEIGPMTPRDVFLLLRSHTELDAEQAEIAVALDALASPLIALLTEVGGTFRPSGPRRSTVKRLELLVDNLLPSRPAV